MAFTLKPAVRSEAKARVALIGPTGSGKTWTALEWATFLGARVAVIDTENGSASLYADQYSFDTAAWGPPYDAARLAATIGEIAAAYDVVVVDSLTHFWNGAGGVLDKVEAAAAKNRGNAYAGWKIGTPIWRSLLDALIYAPAHVIVTMRSKMDYVQQKGDDGRTTIEKVGMAPVARNDVEYEFTVVGELDQTHRMTITKSRCAALADQVAPPHQAGKLALTLAEWLNSADADAAPARPEPEAEPEPVDPNAITPEQLKKLHACFNDVGITDRDQRLEYAAAVVGHDLATSKALTKREAHDVIEALIADAARIANTTTEGEAH